MSQAARQEWFTPTRVALTVVLVVLSIRLVGWAVQFGTESLQQDFASYYAAGQAASRGLSPYVNHVDADPPIWDGVASYRHSRFLYLPVVATAFRPLAWMSYPLAKFAWIGLALAALASAVWQSARAAQLSRRATPLLILAVIALAYFPVLTLLERGQIDSVTLALLCAAVSMLVLDRRLFVAGLLFAVATTIKLQGIYLLPFLLVRRRWPTLAGFAAGAVAVVLLSLVVHGSAPLVRYVGDELPRISRYGDRGPRASRLDPRALRPLLGDAGPGRTMLQGREYAVEALTFEINASAVRTPVGRAVWNGFKSLGLPLAPAQVSFAFLAAGFALMLGWQWRFGPPVDRVGELAYWCAVLALVLLCAPLTWVMATIWLLPVAAVIIGGFVDRRRPGHAVPLTLCALGLVLAGLPETAVSWIPGVARSRYVVAELLCLAGLLGVWRARNRVGS